MKNWDHIYNRLQQRKQKSVKSSLPMLLVQVLYRLNKNPIIYRCLDSKSNA